MTSRRLAYRCGRRPSSVLKTRAGVTATIRWSGTVTAVSVPGGQHLGTTTFAAAGVDAAGRRMHRLRAGDLREHVPRLAPAGRGGPPPRAASVRRAIVADRGAR